MTLLIGDETGGELGVALREPVPDDDHRDARRDADDDEPDHVLGVAAHQRDGER